MRQQLSEVRIPLSSHMDGPSVLSEGASDPSRCRSIGGRSIGGRQVPAARALPAPHEACGPDQLRMPGRRPATVSRCRACQPLDFGRVGRSLGPVMGNHSSSDTLPPSPTTRGLSQAPLSLIYATTPNLTRTELNPEFSRSWTGPTV